MFGVAESTLGLTICGSCVMTRLPPPPEDDLDKAYTTDVGTDLSYLSQEGQRKLARARKDQSKSASQVRMDTGKMSLRQPTPLQETLPVPKLKLQSNSIRDRMHPVGSLMLKFNGSGVAEFAEVYLNDVKAHMALRPGRFRLIDESEVSPPKKDPRKALDDARAALEAARAAEKVPEPVLVPPVVHVQEVTPEAPRPLVMKEPALDYRPKSRTRRTTKKSSSRKSEEV